MQRQTYDEPRRYKHDSAKHSGRGQRLPVYENPVKTETGEQIPDDKLLRVGDLAQQTGKTVRAIHLYEEMGLLRPHRRTKGRYRLFGPDAIVRTRWISKLQELGMSLNDIRTIIREWKTLSAPGAMSLMREVYRRQLAETRGQLDRLRALERELSASLDFLESCHACDPNRLVSACHACELHDENEDPPDLVAGLSAQISSSPSSSPR